MTEPWKLHCHFYDILLHTGQLYSGWENYPGSEYLEAS